MNATPQHSAAPVYAVAELVETLRGLVESALPRVWVQGEISNLSRPASGHWYFTLKDARAQLRCVMFRSANFHVRPPPKDGDAVLVRGQVSLYAARGELQLICEHLEPAGEGALLRAFEALKARLAAEGLFDEKLKRPIPPVPRAIGVITSGSGAALRDILTTLSRRFPLATVYLYPVPVQGSEAPPAIVRALAELPRRVPVDVVLLARGGGSLEDLWAFNEESVARAVRACTVPVVCGVGHEIDFTIADFAADLRAPTPTAAAELASPDIADWMERIDQRCAQLTDVLARRTGQCRQALDALRARLQLLHPGRRLRDNAQRLDECTQRLAQANAALLRHARQHQTHLASRLQAATPQRPILLQRRHLQTLQQQLRSAGAAHQQLARTRLARAESLLASLNPRAVLDRGYAIVLDAAGHALTDAGRARAGDALRLQLARGSLDAQVTRANIKKE